MSAQNHAELLHDPSNRACLRDSQNGGIQPVQSQRIGTAWAGLILHKIGVPVKNQLCNARPRFYQLAHGGASKNSSYDTHLYKLCDKAGIKRFCMHALRHTYATRAIESGMQPKVLQKLLGTPAFRQPWTVCSCDRRFTDKRRAAIRGEPNRLKQMV